MGQNLLFIKYLIMKTSARINRIKSLVLLLIGSLAGTIALAQDSTTKSTTTTTTTTTWYTQPWVWIVGGAVLLIILVALLRGGNTRTDTSRTTVIKDKDYWTKSYCKFPRRPVIDRHTRGILQPSRNGLGKISYSVNTNKKDPEISGSLFIVTNDSNSWPVSAPVIWRTDQVPVRSRSLFFYS